MKIINLGRGEGKTTRLIYASEFNNVPILCATSMQKEHIQRKAYEYGLEIPKPITVRDIVTNRCVRQFDNGVLVDEAPFVLEVLLSYLGVTNEVKAITLTEKE